MSRKTLERVQAIFSRFLEERLSLIKFLQDVADAINRQFWIREVTIGLRDQADGKYRYKVMSGLRPDTWEAYKQLAYTHDEFSDPRFYKGRQISQHTRLFLAEDKPFVEGEEGTYTRPILLKTERGSSAECIEGDYLDIHILGDKGDLLGWIELSGTKEGKFPDAMTLRWIELLAQMIGIVIMCETRLRAISSEEDDSKRSRLFARRR
jgi:hypothetical protein